MTGPVRSVSQAFAILRVFSREEAPLTLSDVTRATGLSPSSCLNLLRTLVGEGVLEGRGGKRYGLARGWERLAGLLEGDQARMIARAQPLLSRLAASHDTTTGLWRIEPRERLQLVALGESGSQTRIHMVIGQRQPIGGGATGRALSAAQGLDETELARRFAAVRWGRPLDFPGYALQVGAAAAAGYSVDDGFGHVGVCSLACVVPGQPITYCVSASIFAGSRNADEIRALGLALRGVAAALGQPEGQPDP